MKVYARSEWRIFRLWLHRKITVHLALRDPSRNFRQLEDIGLVPNRRVELVQEKAVLQRNSGHLCISPERLSATDVGSKIHTHKTCNELSSLVQKSEIAVLNGYASNFRSDGQFWFAYEGFILNCHFWRSWNSGWISHSGCVRSNQCCPRFGRWDCRSRICGNAL